MGKKCEPHQLRHAAAFLTQENYIHSAFGRGRRQAGRELEGGL